MGCGHCHKKSSGCSNLRWCSQKCEPVCRHAHKYFVRRCVQRVHLQRCWKALWGWHPYFNTYLDFPDLAKLHINNTFIIHNLFLVLPMSTLFFPPARVVIVFNCGHHRNNLLCLTCITDHLHHLPSVCEWGLSLASGEYYFNELKRTILH